MFLGKEGQDLGDDGVQSLRYLRLFMHLHVKSIRHFIIHDIVSLHLRLVAGKLFTFKFECMVL